MKNNKVILGVGSFLLIASLFTTGCGKEVKLSSKAVVGLEDGEVTVNEFYKEIKADNISKLIDMIDHKVLDEAYKKTEEEDKEVKKQIDNMKDYYPTEDTFKKVIKQYFGATSEEELESTLRLEFKRKKAVEEYIEKNLTDSEIKKYYNENIYGDMSAKHILFSVETTESATIEEKAEAEKNALEKAQEVIEKLNNGEKFDDLVKEYSSDEGTKNKGGDLGKFSYDDMVEEFSSACAKLNIDEYTKEPVKTSYGYHIILKTAQEDKPTLKKVKAKIKEKLREKKLEDDNSLYYQTLRSIREESGITWNDSKLKNAYNDYMNEIIESSKNS